MPLLIAAVAMAAYCNTLAVPFLFDDIDSIELNRSIRSLSNLRAIVVPPLQMSVSGRPIVHLSLAINYAISGLRVAGYHVFNILVHVGAAILLFAVIRRTLVSRRLADRFGGHASWLALVIALLWVAHPLQTMSVTYTVQRAESMMALFYLLALYGVIRGATGDSPLPWYAVAVVACALGMGCKEAMVTAPVVILLYDRAFLGESLSEVRRRRWLLYLALAGTWMILIGLIWSGPRSETAGFSQKTVKSLEYLYTQPEVILHYLRLVVWPRPLCIDYDWPLVKSMTQAAQAALAILVLLGISLWALRRNRPIGFAGAAFFLILSPSSSFVPVIIVASEHRMYLALAIVLSCIVLALYAILNRRSAALPLAVPAPPSLRNAAAVAVAIAATAALAWATILRNRAYLSELALWADTVQKQPASPRARNGLGCALYLLGRNEESIEQFQIALRTLPNYTNARYNLAEALVHLGRRDEAEVEYRRVLAFKPDDFQVLAGLGDVQAARKETANAINSYRRALALRPDMVRALSRLGLVLVSQGEHTESVALLKTAVELQPDDSPLQYQFGIALAAAGRFNEAADHFNRAVQLDPANHAARRSLAIALAMAGRYPESLVHYRSALESEPQSADLRANFGIALSRVGDTAAAVSELRTALQLNPAHSEAQKELAVLLGRQPGNTTQSTDRGANRP